MPTLIKPVLCYIDTSPQRHEMFGHALAALGADYTLRAYENLSQALLACEQAWERGEQLPALLLYSVQGHADVAPLERFVEHELFASLPLILTSPVGERLRSLETVYRRANLVHTGHTPHSPEEVIELARKTMSHIEATRLEDTIDVRPANFLLLSEEAYLEETLLAFFDTHSAEAHLTCTRDVNEGLDLFTKQAWDHVLLDANLCADDAFTLLECMRADPVHWSTPVLMLTEFVDAHFAKRAAEFGWPPFLLKATLTQESFFAAIAAMSEGAQELLGAQKATACLEAKNKLLRRQNEHAQRELSRLAETLEHTTTSLRRESSARGELAEKLRTADRLATVGRLARGLAGVINNPLSYAMGNLELCRKLLNEDIGTMLRGAIPDRESLQMLEEVLKEFDDSMHEALEGMGRVGEVASNLARFSRIPEDQFTAIDPKAILDTVFRLMSHELSGPGKVRTDFQETPPILAQRAGLVQIFTNLLTHITELRSEHDSTLWIRTESRHHSARITIEDRSVALTPHDFERIFEPRSLNARQAPPSTEADVLSLPLVYHLVHELGGEIDARSHTNSGLRFTLTFPSYHSLTSEAVLRITGHHQKISSSV